MYRDTYLNMKIIIKFIIQLMYRDTYLNMKILLNLFYSSCRDTYLEKKAFTFIFKWQYFSHIVIHKININNLLPI